MPVDSARNLQLVKTIRNLIIPGVILLACASNCHAANNDEFLKSLDLTLDQLRNVKVASATKTEESSRLSPAVVTVLSAQDIAAYGYKTVAELLSHVVGFVDDYDLAVHNFGVRGINSGVRSGSRTIKFMIDGQPVAFQSNSQHYIDLEFIPIALVKRVEIVRGPVSALYGANAFLGVVNVVTKKGSNIGRSVSGSFKKLAHGGPGYDISAAYGGSHGDWKWGGGIQMAEQNRQGIVLPRRSPYYNLAPRTTAVADIARPRVIYARLSNDNPGGRRVSIAAYYQQLNVDNPFSDLNPLRSEGSTRIDLGNAFLRADYRVPLSARSSLSAFAAYSHGATLGEDKIEVGAPSYYFRRNLGFRQGSAGLEWRQKFLHADSLLVGMDGSWASDDIETFSRVDRATGVPVPLSAPQKTSIRGSALYVQWLHNFNRNWRSIVGARFDHDSVIGGQTSTRLGLVGQLPYGMVLKLLTGSSFQAPSPELLYRHAVQAGDIIGNPKLDAEHARTAEVSLSFPVRNYLQVAATYYNTRVFDLLGYQTDGTNLLATNASASRTNGVEVELRLVWHGIDAYMNYAWQHTRVDPNAHSIYVLENPTTAPLSPTNVLNFGAHYYWPLLDTQIAWETRWVGTRPASTENVLVANEFYHLDAYSVSTLTATTQRFRLASEGQTLISLRIKDLFDSQYVNPGFGGIDFPSPGRSISVEIEQRF